MECTFVMEHASECARYVDKWRYRLLESRVKLHHDGSKVAEGIIDTRYFGEK